MRNGPDTFKWEFCPELFIELIVASEQLLNQFVLIPQTNSEELGWKLFVDGALETRPRYEKA